MQTSDFPAYIVRSFQNKSIPMDFVKKKLVLWQKKKKYKFKIGGVWGQTQNSRRLYTIPLRSTPNDWTHHAHVRNYRHLWRYKYVYKIHKHTNTKPMKLRMRNARTKTINLVPSGLMIGNITNKTNITG